MAEALRRFRGALPGLLLLAAFAGADEPELTLQGLPHGCAPIYAATSNRLSLHTEPSPASPRREIDYEEGWALPYDREEVVIQVERRGLFSSFEEYPLSYCRPALRGKQHLKIGEPVTLLFSLGATRHQVEVRNSRCRLEMDLTRADLHIVNRNRARLWLRVLYGDGSPAGWLLQDGSQSALAGRECPAGGG